MRKEPVELPPGRVVEFLRVHWGIRASGVRYAPVGYGSHHWIASNDEGPAWFVTADRLAGRRLAELAASAEVARELAADGCDFVLAPIPDLTNALVCTATAGWAMQLTPYLAGWSTDQGAWTDPAEQRAIARMVGVVHAAKPLASVPRWDPTPAYRDEIESAVRSLDRPWTAGSYSERTRDVLADNYAVVAGLLTRYDTLRAAVENDADPWVLTHGEPDSDNVIRTGDGRMFLIDWTSVAIAPRERDLYDILQGPADVTADYQRTAGPHSARPAAMAMIGLYWRLSHLGHDITRLRRSDTADLTAAWNRLQERLQRAPSHVS